MINNFKETGNFAHTSVMLSECIDALELKKEGIYLDLTLGAGGHSLAILNSSVQKLISFDRDIEAIENARILFESFSNIDIVHSNFKDVKEVLHNMNINEIDGALIDLGVSSHQIDKDHRGFSYTKNTPLDMRMNQKDSKTAMNVLNEYDESSLIKIIKEYGEEKKGAKFIARAIISARPLYTTGQLVSVIRSAVPVKYENAAIKRTFQAIRIEVNDELSIIENTLKDIISFLKPSGKIGVITFHSLEDRIVKHTFRELENPCNCPRSLPCVCGKEKVFTTEKVKLPTKDEITSNSRSKSAKLRVGKKIGDSYASTKKAYTKN